MITLGGLPRKTIFKSNNLYELKEIDTLVEQHVNRFLSAYNLKLGFSLEHKLEHTSSAMVFFKKCHYALNPLPVIHLAEEECLKNKKDFIFKFRGLNEVDNPFYLKLARYLLLGEPFNVKDPDIFNHQEGKLLGIHEFLNTWKKTMEEMGGFDRFESMKYPCERVFEKRTFKFDFSEVAVPDALASKRLLNRSDKDSEKYKSMLLNNVPFETVFKEKTEDVQNFLKLEVKRVVRKRLPKRVLQKHLTKDF